MGNYKATAHSTDINRSTIVFNWLRIYKQTLIQYTSVYWNVVPEMWA